MSVTVPTVIIERRKDIVTIKNKEIPNTKEKWARDYSSGFEKRLQDYFMRQQYGI